MVRFFFTHERPLASTLFRNVSCKQGYALNYYNVYFQMFNARHRIVSYKQADRNRGKFM